MLTACNSQNIRCIALHSEKEGNPYYCPECKQEVILKKGLKKVHHFAHKPPVNCAFGAGESEKHYKVKYEIYKALKDEPNCSKCELERILKGVRPDVSLKINDSYVAIEIQKSAISPQVILERFKRYTQLKIHLIWVIPENHPEYVPRDSNDDGSHKRLCKPNDWQKYLHAIHYGRLYYWQNGANVKPIHLSSYGYKVQEGNWIDDNEELADLEGTHWHNENYDEAFYGGHMKYSKSKKEVICHKNNGEDTVLHLAKDFQALKRDVKTFEGIEYPEAKLWIDKLKKWW